MTNSKKPNKFDASIIWVALLLLAGVALAIGGLIIITQNLFTEGVDNMFEGITYASLGIILIMVMALMVAYQKTIDQMNEYIAQARSLVKKAQQQNIKPNSGFPMSTMMFFGGMPNDMDPTQMAEYRRQTLKKYMGYQSEIQDMTDQELQTELNKAENEENFERAAAIRDEIHKRENGENNLDS